MWPGSKRRLYISGRDGTAEVLEDQLVAFTFRHEEAGDEAKRQAFAGATRHGGGASSPMAMSHENHRENLRDFFDALDENRAPALDGVEAAKAVNVIDAAYQSARSGVPVRVD
jgi:predicted dehydrogenase